MAWRTSKNKYNARKCSFGGRSYHSRAEAEMAMWLTSLEQQGHIKELNKQKRISLDVNGVHIANHYVDFEVVLLNGRTKWVECKGMPTDTWRMKKRLVEALYPTTEYLVNPTEKQLFL
jgi:hypothetical protein